MSILRKVGEDMQRFSGREKMRTGNRVASVVLAATLGFSSFSALAMADTKTGNVSARGYERIVFPESGSCGEDLNYEIEDGVLTISGTGSKIDHQAFYVLGKDYESVPEINTVIIPQNVKEIGKLAFGGRDDIETVVIESADTIKFGYASFAMCRNLEDVVIQANSADLSAGGAFAGCSKLQRVVLPGMDIRFGVDTFSADATINVLLPNVLNLEFLDQDVWGQNMDHVSSRNTLYHVPYTRTGDFDSVITSEDVGSFVYDLIGETATYELADDILFIRGSGDLFNSLSGSTPWAESADSISKIIIDSGITGIPQNTFRGCTNVKTILCKADPEKLSWECDSENEFTSGKQTKCQVPVEYYDGYQDAKFSGVNASFVKREVMIGGAMAGSEFFLIVELPIRDDGSYSNYTVVVGNKTESPNVYQQDGLIPVSCSAKDMNDQIKVKVFDRDANSTLLDSKVSIASYLKAIANGEEYSAYQDQAKALLRYGAAAQLYFDTAANEEDYVNFGIVDYDFASLNNLDYSGLHTYDGLEFRSWLALEKSTYAGITLRFGSNLGVYMFFVLKEGASQEEAITELQDRIEGGSQYVYGGKDEVIYVKASADISSLGDPVFIFKGENENQPVSALDYVVKVIKSQATTDKMADLQTLCQALYAYNLEINGSAGQ